MFVVTEAIGDERESREVGIPDGQANVRAILRRGVAVVLALEVSISDIVFFFSSRRRHTRFDCDWSSDVCSSDLVVKSSFSSYPNLLKEDFTTVSVGAFLVTYDYNLQFTVGHLIRFARSLCQNFQIGRASCRERV